jgi:hypothetical protein
MDEAAKFRDIGVTEGRGRQETMQRQGPTDKCWFGAGNLAFLYRDRPEKRTQYPLAFRESAGSLLFL